MPYKDPEIKRKYHREYNANLRKLDPEKAKPKRRLDYHKDLYAKDPSKSLQRSAKWRLANPEKVRSSDRRGVCRKFGITIDDYDRMMLEQNGVCAICFRTDSAGRSLAIDHCHQTGRVRGLLCGKCNKSLGGFNDNPQLLQAAIDYLKR